MLSFPASYNVPQPPPQQSSPLPRQSSGSPLPRRTDSLSSSIAKPKPTHPLAQSKEDVKFARVVLDTPIVGEEDHIGGEEDRERRREDRERELIEALARMTGWVEELTTLLQQAYKNQTDLETALTLTRSNLQLALANNEMLEEALKRGGGKDVGWRRWSDREGVRRTGSVKEFPTHERPASVADAPSSHPQQQQPSPPQQQSGPSRFFNFKSPLQRVSSSANTSPTEGDSSPALLPSINIPSASSSRSGTPVQNGIAEIPPTPGTAWSTASAAYSTRTRTRTPSPPSPSEREKQLTAALEKERKARQAVITEKAQLEEELESLSQALFEEANKMVSHANRKLAETEEELRVATAQKEALKGALRIVEGENGALRRWSASSGSSPGALEDEAGRSPVGARASEGGAAQGQELHAPPPVAVGESEPGTPMLARQAPSPSASPAPAPPAPPAPPGLSTSIPSLTVTGAGAAADSFWSPTTPSTNAPSPISGPSPSPSASASVSTGLSPSTAPLTPNRTSTAPLSPNSTFIALLNPNRASSTEPLSPNRASSAEPPNTPGTVPLSANTASPPSAHSPFTTRSGHRWSVIPKTPRSRSAVRNEFEDAMRRMQGMVEGEDGGEGEGEDEGEGESSHEGEEPHGGEWDGEDEEKEEDAYAGGEVSPRIEFARKGSESEVEDELAGAVRGENPWTS